ncbi:MAG: hypothetical protein IJG85_00325, partial [Eubacteriaceae bacterium]|nr:hypothetical protein [Eubacteriaceae bacterium]
CELTVACSQSRFAHGLRSWASLAWHTHRLCLRLRSSITVSCAQSSEVGGGEAMCSATFSNLKSGSAGFLPELLIIHHSSLIIHHSSSILPLREKRTTANSFLSTKNIPI